MYIENYLEEILFDSILINKKGVVFLIDLFVFIWVGFVCDYVYL